MMHTIENAVASCEKMLNPMDWIPFVSSFSGMVRILAGIVEIAASAAFIYLKSTHQLLTTPQGRIGFVFEEGAIYFTHAVANMIRGAIAMLPGVNMALCVYDHKIGRLVYPLEEIPYSKIYPICLESFSV